MATDRLIAAMPSSAKLRSIASSRCKAGDLVLSHAAIANGFMLYGERWPLWNPHRGIFKPRAMP